MTTCYILFSLMLALLPLRAAAQTDGDIKQLEKQMYKLYPTRNTEEFLSVTEQLKQAARKTGDDKLFYKAWANQALHYANTSRRNKGLQTSKAIQDYALQQDNKFGLYTSTHVTAYILGLMGNTDDALTQYQKAIDYLHNYFPSESAAADLIEMAKLEYSLNHVEKAIALCSKALSEPGVSDRHRMNALSVMCLSVADSNTYHHPDYKERFYHYYQEREKAKAAHGNDGIMGQRVEVWKHILDGDFDQALAITAKMPKSNMNKYALEQYIYRQKGDYKEAYDRQWRYYWRRDSLNEARNAHLLMEMSTALDLGRLESETKDLRLNNQQLALDKAASELEQRKLREEALSLTLEKQQIELQNRDIALRNATVQRQNDSLDHVNKDLAISEYKSKIEAQENAEQARYILNMAVSTIVLLVIGALAYFLYRRNQHMRHLSQINSQLSKANSDLKTAYDQLEATTTAKERIESELRIARGIQMGMVPWQFPPFPERKDIDLYASMAPARQVGGDLYDFQLQGDKLYVCIGDVSGKGVPASMTMAVAVSLFRNVAKEGFPPAYIATRLNDVLCDHNESGMFVSMFIAQIDLSSGRMDFCNAGHNPPLIIEDPLPGHDACRPHFMEMEPNVPIGILPDMEFIGETLDNIKGLTILLYTDGLTEAENLTHEQFGEDRLTSFFLRRPYKDSQETIELLRAAVAAHAGEAEASDDLTMVCLKVD